MKRRKFLAGSAAAGVAVAASFPKPAISQGLRQWKMVMTWQKTLPGLGTGAVRLAKRITALSEGKLEVLPYGGGELVPPLEIFDAVSQGTAEMGHSSPYYWLNKHTASAFFCAVPGGLTAQEQNAWVYFAGGQQLWDKLYAPFGLRAFPAGNTGAQMGGWFNREIKTVDDLKGLKMRIPGLAGEVLNLLGGSSQTISPQELFTSMQSGVIDALEWVGPWNDLALGFHKVSKYYYGPGFHEAGPMLELMVNKAAFEQLSPELQRIIKVACAAENDLMAAEYYANNVRAMQVLRNDHSTDVRSFPPEVLKSFFKVSEEVVANVGSKDALAKEIYESYAGFRKASMAMTPVMELGFLQARNQNRSDA
ncbi:MAG: TRAP transporter substrate-binding protein [Hyphomicrobiales bacterium]|nr:TRAP transporter substrate-binding protein [Hyphomicrobiales bacterium]